jgi:hypothetical protein
MIALGQGFYYLYSSAEALQGYQLDTLFYSYRFPDYAPWRLTITTTSGNISGATLVNGLATPTPVPSSLVLLGTGAACFGLSVLCRRRRKRAA